VYSEWKLEECSFDPFRFTVPYCESFEPVGGEFGSGWIRNAYSKYGIANYYHRFKAVMSLPLNFRRFPFDEHLLKLLVMPKSQIAEYLQFVPFEEEESEKDWIKKCWKSFYLDEWYFGTNPKIEMIPNYEAEGARNSVMAFSIPVARKTHYYVWNVLWLMYFLNIITWCVFIIDSSDLSDRLGATITIFLSELAFNLIISSILPRVSYNTYFSIFFLVNYLTLALQSLEHVLSYELNQHTDNPNIAYYLDYCFVFAYFAIHTSLVIVCAFLSRAHDLKHHKAIELEIESQKKIEEADSFKQD